MVLQMMQMLDQEIAPPLSRAKQRLHFGKSSRFDLPPLPDDLRADETGADDLMAAGYDLPPGADSAARVTPASGAEPARHRSRSSLDDVFHHLVHVSEQHDRVVVGHDHPAVMGRR